MIKVDETIERILKETKEEFENKYKKEISIEEIYKVLNKQVDITLLGIKVRVDVHWIKFGKFLFTRYTDRKDAKRKYFKELENPDYGLTSEQIEEKKAEYMRDYIKDLETKDINRQKKTTVEELLIEESLINTLKVEATDNNLPKFTNITKKNYGN